ncbi:MAG TPA: glycosyltransferase family 87 protein, partial [Tepidisphaeraceae bacterium]
MGAAAARWSNLAIVRASSGKRLWLAAAGIAIFIATVWTAHALGSREENREPGFGLDFIAFYTAGTFVREGRLGDLYSLDAVHQFQRELAAANHFDIGRACGPWWNPPFYALVFGPLSRLPYPTAAGIWIAFNLACFAAACVLLCRMLPAETGWRSRALAPVLIVLSAPFILAVSHAQNTCTSLLLLTATVTLWRSRRAFLAGVVGGLMFYKPQVATVLAAVLVIDLGWRAVAGYAITGSALLLTNLIALPGTLVDYVHRLPKNV